MNLCKNCKHYAPILKYDLCDHPSVKHSAIDGKPVSQCFMVRDETIGKCGAEGKLFEQKPPVEAPIETPKKRPLWRLLLG